MITSETSSHFYNAWPQHLQSDKFGLQTGNLATTTRGNLTSVHPSKPETPALQNDIYSNVGIEIPPPPAKEPCESGNSDSKKDGCACKRSGKSTHPLLWLGGIAGALFLMGRASK